MFLHVVSGARNLCSPCCHCKGSVSLSSVSFMLDSEYPLGILTSFMSVVCALSSGTLGTSFDTLRIDVRHHDALPSGQDEGHR